MIMDSLYHANMIKACYITIFQKKPGENPPAYADYDFSLIGMSRSSCISFGSVFSRKT